MGCGLSTSEPIAVGDLEIDLERRAVEIRGEQATLTYVEFEVLTALAGAPGRVFTREVGMTPARFVESVRVEAARRRLEESAHGVESVFTMLTVGLALPPRRISLINLV